MEFWPRSVVMSAAIAVPAREGPPSANDRFKARFRGRFWGSIIFAVAAHFVALQYSPELAVADFSFTSGDLTAIELPPEIEIPPPPRKVARPATPVISDVEVSEDVTIAPTTFEFNVVDNLPPPPTEGAAAAAEDDIASAPTFTPYTVAPTLLNRDDVARAMVASYPDMLRRSGIGGVVHVYFFINKDGVVQDFRIHRSSGYAQLDEAALAVADVYRFSPALNRDKLVPVWVLFPIEFQVR
jgi:protein TonB